MQTFLRTRSSNRAGRPAPSYTQHRHFESLFIDERCDSTFIGKLHRRRDDHDFCCPGAERAVERVALFHFVG